MTTTAGAGVRGRLLAALAAGAAASLLLGGAACVRQHEARMKLEAGRPYYYASFTGYAPPVKPHNAIDYAQAEASTAFSVFVFDDAGRVVSFEKWLTTRAPQPSAALDGRATTPGVHFFAAATDPPFRPAAPLSLDDTRDLREYYRLEVAPHDGTPRMELVRRERTLRHQYTYWENGRLREARYDADGAPSTVDRFDRDGRRISPAHNSPGATP